MFVSMSLCLLSGLSSVSRLRVCSVGQFVGPLLKTRGFDVHGLGDSDWVQFCHRFFFHACVSSFGFSCETLVPFLFACKFLLHPFLGAISSLLSCSMMPFVVGFLSSTFESDIPCLALVPGFFVGSLSSFPPFVPPFWVGAAVNAQVKTFWVWFCHILFGSLSLLGQGLLL